MEFVISLPMDIIGNSDILNFSFSIYWQNIAWFIAIAPTGLSLSRGFVEALPMRMLQHLLLESRTIPTHGENLKSLCLYSYIAKQSF